jgi:hypothetical protein
MPDEERYPTMRFYTCSDCSQVFTGSLTGDNVCPRCLKPLKRRADEPFFTIGQEGKHISVRIRGGSYRIGDLAQLKAALEKAESGSPRSIAFLFDGNSVLDSGFLNLMARTVYQQAQAGSRVFVAAQNPHMLESLQVLGLDRVVTVLPDEQAYQAAMAALDSQG